MRKKDQWKVYDIYSHKSTYFSVETKKSFWQKKFFPKGLIKGGLTVLISVLAIYGIVQAGTITPPSGVPSAKFYTLSEIYNFINSNTTATAGDHSFTFADDLSGSGRTLTEIYDSLAGLISADKVKLETTYLAVDGTLVPSGGDAEVGNVLSGKTFFGDSQATWDLQTGTMTDNGSFALTCTDSEQAVTAGYYSGGTLSGDANLISANIKSGVTIFGIDGDGNVVDTSSGDAIAGDILSGKIAWVDGASVSGSISNCGSEGSQSCYATGTYFAGTSKTVSNSATSQSAGYYPAFDLATVDTDLTASKIMSGVNIFGVSGTLLKNVYNGSATSGATDYTFYTQALGGVDDYNDAQSAMPTGSYVGSWTDCNAGNNWCGTGETDIADAKDESTGLVWSVKIDDAGDDTQSWFWANNCYEPETAENPGTCTTHGDDACQCVKKTSAKTGCEALGDGGWRLPYQKELMQAYINGSSKSSVSYLSNINNVYWSATTLSYSTRNAWVVTLFNGNTSYDTKVTSGSYKVRCVR